MRQKQNKQFLNHNKNDKFLIGLQRFRVVVHKQVEVSQRQVNFGSFDPVFPQFFAIAFSLQLAPFQMQGPRSLLKTIDRLDEKKIILFSRV
ncbi:hypothetical protein BpHYR1_029790 [Brachionus plicatilis]|uniref:Uncharacterized protein n=1 Tax=Brachionus plicatilis TaxID=10195 RepID=A0A3M7RB68_BRAPC|nr:hypothetical protein BpHYR1_029790 [Brachionus plicatilis]